MSSVLTLVNSVIVVDHSEQGFDVSERSLGCKMQSQLRSRLAKIQQSSI
jgi:hypothetical protein